MQAFSMLSLSALLAVTSPPSRAQSDEQAQTEVMYDNAHVRVLKQTIQPRQRIPSDEASRDRVLIWLDQGQITETASDGKPERLEFRSGAVQWAPAAIADTVENAGNQPIQLIEIELKGKQQPPVTIPDLDPLKVDPKHYHLELENAHVRVVRVRFGPLENGVVHQHVRNYLVVYMTHQAKGERGEVHLHLDEGTTTHTENNPLNQPVERIAVELK
jgi:hypothetical protein